MRTFKVFLSRPLQRIYDFHALRGPRMVGASSLVHLLLLGFVTTFVLGVTGGQSTFQATMGGLAMMILLELGACVTSMLAQMVGESLSSASATRFTGVRIVSVQDVNGTTQIFFEPKRREVTRLDEDNVPILTVRERAREVHSLTLPVSVSDVDALRVLCDSGDVGEIVSYQMNETSAAMHFAEFPGMFGQHRFVFDRWHGAC